MTRHTHKHAWTEAEQQRAETQPQIVRRLDVLADEQHALRDRLLAAAQIAQAAYGDEIHWGEFAERAGAHFSEVVNVTDHVDRIDAQVCVATTREVCVIAYRGTPSHSLDAWLRNLQSRQSDYLWGRVHSGFLTEYLALEQRLQAVLKYCHKQQQLVIVGHSKGGALATIDAFTRNRMNRQRGTVYTFGSPRCLAWNCAEYLDADRCYYGPPHYRCRHSNDAVPLVPGLLNLARYHHCGELVLIAEDGQLLDRPTRWQRLREAFAGYRFDALEDHFIGSYLAALEIGHDHA